MQHQLGRGLLRSCSGDIPFDCDDAGNEVAVMLRVEKKAESAFERHSRFGGEGCAVSEKFKKTIMRAKFTIELSSV